MITPLPARQDWHSERSTEIIAHEAARFIHEEASSDPLITVTRAMSIKHGDQVIVFVTVFPVEATRKALAFLDRHREAFSDHLKSHARLGPLPRIDFQIDNTEQYDTVGGGPGGN